MVGQTLDIKGMSCAACANRVEHITGNLRGVHHASVNFATEKLTISYDPHTIDISDIRKAIEHAGYHVIDTSTSNSSEDKVLLKQKEIKLLWLKFIISAAFGLPLLYIAMAPMIPWLPFPSLKPTDNPLAYSLIQLGLVIPIIGVGYKFYTVGFKALWQRSPNMDSLIAVGTTSAVLYSIYSVIQIALGDPHSVHALYFETAGVIITLILLGKSLEAVSKAKTGQAIKKLMGLAPKTAIIIKEGMEITIPISQVMVGDILVVKPGAKIPVDGTVTEGFTSINESMLTGESMPVPKQAGDHVYAASANNNGMIKFRAEKVGSQTVFAQIVKLVEDAQNSKAPIAQLADVVSGYFVPIVCTIALIAGIAWYIASLYNPSLLPQDNSPLEFSLTIFISVLVIACPCALGLATPTAIMVGTGKGAEMGILIKGGEALELAHKINTIVLDKTGTITQGKPEVTNVLAIKGVSADYLLQLAASAEKGSEHPLGQAIVQRAESRNISLLELKHFNSITGLGIETTLLSPQPEEGELHVLIGNRKLMEQKSVELSKFEQVADQLSKEGKTPIYIAEKGVLCGVIAVADVVKDSSPKAIDVLHKMGLETVMITGDNRETAIAIARQVGIDKVLSEVLPKDKSEQVKKLQTDGLNVAMVGDGINDAPALAQADIGIAIGSGTDVAMESADIVLMRSDLMDVSAAINLSKKTIVTIKQNLFWAFGYNIIGIPIAAGVLYLFGGPLMNPMFAAAAMSLSSVSVLANALRLRKRVMN